MQTFRTDVLNNENLELPDFSKYFNEKKRREMNSRIGL